MAKPHGALTTDWPLAQFGEKKARAAEKYREFVKHGIEEKSIHDEVKGQSILGREDFIEKLIGRVRGYERVKEIPRSQRYLGRPSLAEQFKGAKEKKRRDRKISEAVMRHGYSQREIAEHLGMHCSTISRANVS